jgi:hypothetical protein
MVPREIAEKYGKSISAVQAALKKLGVRRSISEARKLYWKKKRGEKIA